MKQLNLEDLGSPGAELLAIIRQYLRNFISTAFLAEVTAVYDDNGSARVDVEAVNRFKGDNGQELPGKKVLNLMVGVIGGSGWTVSYPIAVGDTGLCITSKYDLTSFLETGAAGVTKLSRTFDGADSVFIPLALFLQPAVTADLEIKSSNEKTVVTITPEGNIAIKNEGNISVANKGDMTATVEGSITAEAKGPVTISSDDKAAIECSEAEIRAQSKARVKCSSVEIGAGALESVIKGETFMTFFNAHTHTGNMGSPTSPPVVPMTGAQLSAEVKAS